MSEMTQADLPGSTSDAGPGSSPVVGRRIVTRQRLIGLTVIAILLSIWLIATVGGFVRPLFVPGPADLARGFEQWGPSMPDDIWQTVGLRIVPGFILGGLVGLVVGILMAISQTFRAVADPIVEVVRPLPPLALIPLLILWFGIGIGTHVVMIAFGTFIVMVVTAYEAVRNVPPIYLQAAATLGASRAQTFRRVIVPAIVPDIFGGVRVAVAASFGYAVAAELMGAQGGVGWFMVTSRRYLLTENIVAALIVIVVMAFLADQLVRWVNRRLTSWKPRA
jgi:ABC-type nitrate/sulfonate/bicarbonate transport system permease component